MKITFFGTAASEGFPGLFCSCKYCIRARELGGKNIRGRSQALIGDDLLIDLPPDTMSYFQRYRVRGDKIKTLLITHGHSDHYFPHDLCLRGSWYAHDMAEEFLDVICPDSVFDDCSRTLEKADDDVKKGIRLKRASLYEPMEINGYKIIAMRARHDFSRSAVIYTVERDGKCLLYAHDTGYFYDEVFDYIKDKGIRFDFASFDCTNAFLPSKETDSHMGFDNVERVIDRLKTMGAVDKKALLFVNHFSHNGNALHEYLEVRASKIGCKVSFDGCKVEF